MSSVEKRYYGQGIFSQETYKFKKERDLRDINLIGKKSVRYK